MNRALYLEQIQQIQNRLDYCTVTNDVAAVYTNLEEVVHEVTKITRALQDAEKEHGTG